MKKLYPLKFIPVQKDKTWGGESCDISGFEEESSIVSEGYLEKNSLYDIIETYMGDIVGDDNYKYFGNEFPLLVKLLNIQERLSVQVHPDDETAFDRHNSYGKSEAWYVLESSPDSIIYMGFNKGLSPTEFYQRCKDETLEEVLNIYHPQKGDFFFIESGIVHSAGGGLIIAEVQQLSDVTYRIYDWGREHNPKTKREMHLDLAFDSINYTKYDPTKYFVPAGKDVKENISSTATLSRNNYFTISLLNLHDQLHLSTEKFNSFVLYYSIEGNATIEPSLTKLSKGEWVLVPAAQGDFCISPDPNGAKLLQVFVEPQPEEEDSYLIPEETNQNEQ